MALGPFYRFFSSMDLLFRRIGSLREQAGEEFEVSRRTDGVGQKYIVRLGRKKKKGENRRSEGECGRREGAVSLKYFWRL